MVEWSHRIPDQERQNRRRGRAVWCASMALAISLFSISPGGIFVSHADEPSAEIAGPAEVETALAESPVEDVPSDPIQESDDADPMTSPDPEGESEVGEEDRVESDSDALSDEEDVPSGSDDDSRGPEPEEDGSDLLADAHEVGEDDLGIEDEALELPVEEENLEDDPASIQNLDDTFMPMSMGFPDGEVVFVEDFGTPTGSIPTTLQAGYSSQGISYYAGWYWTLPTYCNGFITSANVLVSKADINQVYCGPNGGDPTATQSEDDYGAVRTKAFALGLFNGMSETQARANGALSTNTSGGIPNTTRGDWDAMMLTTGQLGDPADGNPARLQLPGLAGRFLTISVDVAAQCQNGQWFQDPLLDFVLHYGGWGGPGWDGKQLTPDRINVCDPDYGHVLNRQIIDTSVYGINRTSDSDGGAYQNWVYPVTVGTYFGQEALLVPPGVSNFGFRLYNTSEASSTGSGAPADWAQAGNYNGNDGAIDNVSIRDVTPWLTKLFSPARTPIGTTSTLTLTVNNTNEMSAKHGWSFVDTMPEGLTIDATQPATGSCVTSGTTVNLTSTIITVPPNGGRLDAGDDSCTIIVEVTSPTAGIYVNDTNDLANLSQMIGIDSGNAAEVEFYAGELSWSKVDATDGSFLAGSEWTLSGPVVGNEGNTSRTVTDCIGTDEMACAGLLDRDPLPGRFLVRDLVPGTHSLLELAAPPGYQPDTTTRTATVTSGQQNINLGDIQNTRLPGSVTWQKVAEGTENRLAGSIWELIGPGEAAEPIVIEDCVADSPDDCTGPDRDPAAGEFLVEDLPWGEYTLEEIQAPAGYYPRLDPLEVTIDSDSLAVQLGLQGNRPVQAPELPLTGGLGRDFFIGLGISLLILGVGAAGALQVRSRRKGVT